MGAAYEARFVSAALKRGLDVSRPSGDYLPYDLLVESMAGGAWRRVQVKGTTHEQKGKSKTYRITAATGNSRVGKNKITLAHCDVLSVYVDPLDLWYHVPIQFVRAATVNVRPVKGSKAQYERWRDAWDVFY